MKGFAFILKILVRKIRKKKKEKSWEFKQRQSLQSKTEKKKKLRIWTFLRVSHCHSGNIRLRHYFCILHRRFDVESRICHCKHGCSLVCEPHVHLHSHPLKPASCLTLSYLTQKHPTQSITFQFWWEDGNKVKVLSECGVLFSPSIISLLLS